MYNLHAKAVAGRINYIHEQCQGKGYPFIYQIRVVVLVTELKGLFYMIKDSVGLTTPLERNSP